MARTATAPAHTATPSPKEAIATLESTRRETLTLVARLSDEDIERVHSPIMSPLAWDLGHIAAYEDLWLAHRQWGMPLLRPELADRYDAFETPRAIRGEVSTLGAGDARAYMEAVRGRTADAIARHGVGDGVRYELVVRHELQHSETMRQTLALAGLPVSGRGSEPEQPRDLLPAGDGEVGRDGTGQDRTGRDRTGRDGTGEGDGQWLEIPAGPFAMGAGEEGFAYDNERPRHTVEVPAFGIARRPVGHAAWMRFAQDGGYERREFWSPEGWAWRTEQDATYHPEIAGGDPHTPACHVSWFEADAFARANGARLPTEAEWEKAASAGALAAVGIVWEWTQTHFGGYPGFVAFPYREYSEVFFGKTYRVLRGGSWATHPRVASTTFRNWDLPQRRQIFAGLRLATDA
jgi:iron(II)-dependent oxidoreductase